MHLLLMHLPNADQAVVEEDKVINYLLNNLHPVGAAKARFFNSFGFRLDQWPLLAGALKKHGRENPVSKMKQTGFGPRFEVEGPLMAPDGRQPIVRTVWQLDEGDIAPRPITAYPV